MRLIRKLRRLVPVLALLAAILQLVSACSPPPPMATPGNGQSVGPNAPNPTMPAGATHIEPSDPNAICYMGHQLDIRGRPITLDQLLIMTEDDPNSVIDERMVPRAVMAPDGEHPLFRDGSVVYWIGERQGNYGLIVNTFRTRLQIGDVSRGQLIVQGDDLLILPINDSQLSAEIDPNMPMMPGQAGEKRGFTVLLKIGEQEGQINYLRIANFTYEDIRDANGNLGSDGVLDTVKFMFHANTQVYSENFEPLE